ncbi:MAG: sulfotransferase domain-containing protein [Actinomycetes bacterium]
MSDGDVEQGNVWLASYPKSGNTWFRFIWSELIGDGDAMAVTDSDTGSPSPAHSPQPCHTTPFANLMALDARRLTADEIDIVRARVELVGHDRLGPPQLRKTHERYRLSPDGEPLFPARATRAAIVIVRDPRDVACSWSNHFGKSVQEAVDDVCSADVVWAGNAAAGMGRQVLGSWSEHLDSWRRCDEFPVHVIKYEDMLDDACLVTYPVVAAVGLDVTRPQVAQAVEATAFDRLRSMEHDEGFVERVRRSSGPFFRRGQAGGWQEELTAEQVHKIERHHGALMCEMGYELQDPTS